LNKLLLDASAVLAAFEENESHQEDALKLLADESFTLMTLDLARYEVTNVAICSWGRPRVVGSLLALLDYVEEDGGVVESTGALMSRAAEIAERHAISVYDAAYVAAAASGDRQLVSCDERDLVSKGLALFPGDVEGLGDMDKA
jgi:predicted nucleic acid-binding protein